MTTVIHPNVRKLFGVPFHEQKSPEWFEARKGKLTASDVAAAIHKNPYTTQRALFRKKIGEGPKFNGNIATEWGNKYESVAIERYVEQTGRTVFEFGLIPHTKPEFAYLAGSPDGVTACGRLIEVKCPLTREITHEIPGHYLPQVQILMEILDLDVCDFVQFRPATVFMDAEFDVLEIPRDTAWFAKNAPILAEFWKTVTTHLEACVSKNPFPHPSPSKKKRCRSPPGIPQCLFIPEECMTPPTPRPSIEAAAAAAAIPTSR